MYGWRWIVKMEMVADAAAAAAAATFIPWLQCNGDFCLFIRLPRTHTHANTLFCYRKRGGKVILLASMLDDRRWDRRERCRLSKVMILHVITVIKSPPQRSGYRNRHIKTVDVDGCGEFSFVLKKKKKRKKTVANESNVNGRGFNLGFRLN